MTIGWRANALSRQGLQGLLVVIAGTLLLAVLAVAPFLWHARVSASLVDSRQALAPLEARSGSIIGRGAGDSSAASADSVFVQGATVGLALAELQRLIAETADNKGMVLERMQPLPTEQQDGAFVMRMEVDASGGLEAIKNYLHALETGTPLIFVKEAHIGVVQAKIDSEASSRLTLRLVVEAFGWGRNPS